MEEYRQGRVSPRRNIVRIHADNIHWKFYWGTFASIALPPPSCFVTSTFPQDQGSKHYCNNSDWIIAIMSSSGNGTEGETSSQKPNVFLKPFYDICQRKYVRGELSRPSQSDHDTMENVFRFGRSYAIGATVVTFILLRKLPKFHINNKIQQLQAKGQDYTQRNGSNFSLMPRITSRQDGRSIFQEGFLAGLVMTTLDAAVACVIGGATWCYMTPAQELSESTAKIPLAAGKSMLADVFCHDFIQQYKTMDPQKWTKQDREDEIFIQGVHGFIQNCQRRKVYEEQLRADLGISKDTPVDIPKPGVPSDIFIDNNVSDSYEDIQYDNRDTKFG